LTSFDSYKNRWLKTPPVGKKNTPSSHVSAVHVNGFNNNTKEIYKQYVGLSKSYKIYFTDNSQRNSASLSTARCLKQKCLWQL